jgi:hypothetical protein
MDSPHRHEHEHEQEVLGRTNMPTFPTQAESKQYSMPSTPYKISSKSTSRFKSCTPLRNLNVGNFGIVKATVLNWSRGHLQRHHLRTRFHLNSPIYSKLLRGFFAPISEV